MYQQILVPVDGSIHAGHALPWALGIAAKSGATVHLVLVHEPTEYREFSGAHFEDYDQESKAGEAAYLEGVRKKVADGFAGKLQVHHLEGVAQETLAAEAAARSVDLVVMNAHGWGYTSRALLGSVSDYLMRHLHVPLLLLHAHVGAGPLYRPVQFRRILVPLDGSELAGAILPAAEELGRLWSAEYRLFRVVSPPGGTSGAHDSERGGEPLFERSRNRAQQQLEVVAGALRDHSLSVTTEVVVHRKPAAAIVQETAAAECDLVAMSTHGRGGLARFLVGSVADKVVRAAEVPVLVYRPKEV